MSAGGGAVVTIFTQAMSSKWVGIVLLISTAGQFFCTTACQTSASRMLFAFSRDRAVPGHQLWSKLSKNKVPANGVIVTAVIAAIITLPALVEVDINGAPVPGRVLRGGVDRRRRAVPVLRGADLLPLEGGRLVPGRAAGTCGGTLQVDGAGRADRDRHHLDHRACSRRRRAACRGTPSFEWKFVNYTPLLVGGVLILLCIYWHVSVKNWFTGPIKQVDETGEQLEGVS